jgi:hypothetical protein
MSLRSDGHEFDVDTDASTRPGYGTLDDRVDVEMVRDLADGPACRIIMRRGCARYDAQGPDLRQLVDDRVVHSFHEVRVARAAGEIIER